MIRLKLMLLLLFSSITSFSQVKMRTLDELINTVEPGWIHVKTWIDAAKNKVEVLSVDTISAKEALFNTQVTTRSPMGAIVYMTGGLLVDNGWIRILGSGNPKLIRKLPDWNKGKTFNEYGQIPQYLLIADDAIGGFFLLNGGGLGKDVGGILLYMIIFCKKKKRLILVLPSTQNKPNEFQEIRIKYSLFF